MKKIILLSYYLLLTTYYSFSQSNVEVYPTHWWTGMKWNKVQLIIHANNIADNANVKLSYPGRYNW